MEGRQFECTSGLCLGLLSRGKGSNARCDFFLGLSFINDRALQDLLQFAFFSDKAADFTFGVDRFLDFQLAL